MDKRDKLDILNSINEGAAARLCADLIRIPSFSGSEKPVASLLSERLKQSDIEAGTDEFGNLIAVLKGGRPGPRLMFNGHLDVAPTGRRELWGQEPFNPVIKDGILSGRGACDMKAGLAAMTVAAETLFPYRAALAGELILAFNAQEEIGNGMTHILRNKSLIPKWAIIGEATNLNIALGQRYGLLVELKVSGESVHMCHSPKRGIDAVANMIAVLEEIRKMKLPRDKRLGDSRWSITTFTAEPNQFGLINDRCTVVLEMGIAEIGQDVGAPKKKWLAKLQKTIADLKKTRPELNAEVKIVGTLESFYTPPRDPRTRPLLSSLKRNVQFIAKKKPVLHIWDFNTDGSYLSRYHDVVVLGCGPGSEFDAHLPVDSVRIDQINEAARIYVLTALDLLAL